MKPLHIETPFFESHPLSLQTGRSVWLKLETVQPSGSFKIRGIGRACQKFIVDHRIVVEPACGAALATVYDRMAEVELFQSIAVIVCGGATASIEQLNQWAKL